MSRFDRHILWSPFQPIAAVVFSLAGLGAWFLALREVLAQDYALWPMSQGLHANLTQATRATYLAAALAWLLLCAPWWLRMGRAAARKNIANYWAALLAIGLWAWRGYAYNRHEAAAAWRTRETVLGVDLPAALTDGSILLYNGALTLGALLAFLVARWLLRRMLPQRRWQSPPRFMRGLGVGLTLLSLPWIAGIGGSLRPWPQGPDIILISLDATRADRLGCYGHPGGLTPSLDRLAREGELFENAYAQEPWTLTSHMSMLSSLYPDVHGLDFRRSLAPNVWLVAERLRERGYRTAASVRDCYLLSPRFGYGDGFARYEEDKRPAAERCRAAVEWLLQDDRPAFLFLHLYDPHSDTGALPYEAELDSLPRVAFERWAGVGGASEAMRSYNLGEQDIPDTLRPWIARLYDAGLRATDAAVGEFLDRLRAAGRLQNALVLVSADHGEALGERGHYMHEELMQATLQIPLLVHWPGGERAGTRREDLVETVDFAPTMLEAAGLSAESISQGRSLRAPSTRRFAFHRSGPRHAITTEDGWRLEYRLDDAGFEPLALRQLDGSGGDGVDLLADSLLVVDRWLPAIEKLHQANALLAARWRESELELREADVELLRSLGYVE